MSLYRYSLEGKRLLADGVPVASLPYEGDWIDRLESCKDQVQVDHIKSALEENVIQVDPQVLGAQKGSICLGAVFFKACDELHIVAKCGRPPRPFEATLLEACRVAGFTVTTTDAGWEVT
jgi:hypothetical protein